MLGATPLGKHYKFAVTNGNQVAVVLFSDEIQALLVKATSIQFDETFDVVPIQFYQLCNYGRSSFLLVGTLYLRYTV